MKRGIHSRLSELRRSGEIKTGRQLAESMQVSQKDLLFPGEGREVETSFGRCYMRELQFPLEHKHGNTTLAGILTCCGNALVLPSRDNTLANLDPKRSLFLDVETTGLSGGTGTWAFLIGLGWLEESYFMLRQYFLRRPVEERAILRHFTDTAAEFSTMITFNGKLFDLPLLQTRQMLAGLSQTEPRLHLDLLQCARNLWKKRLPSRSLRSIEESILGLQRLEDIPGAEIPGVYFDYLRRGESGRIKQVFHHNALDILSMVTLLERVTQLAAGKSLEHPAETLALGRLCLQAGRHMEGIGYLQETSASSIAPLAEEAIMELALYYKRLGNWPEAVSLWEKTLLHPAANPIVYIELAKYYEHRCRDYQTALKMTEAAQAKINRQVSNAPASSGEVSLQAIQRRLKRLKHRLAATTFGG
ncbi:MAG TPA: ribonuclease H-like domain-containing protein [Candidatus Limnocylindrales bacterium]|nr:ribonuclease H-like domain-containing protein [Candidatus Limnocylindrales bacterium]